MNLMTLLNEGSHADSHLETQRIMQICNACRYCEGFCAVFPAMERRRVFDVGDTAFLANLCHNCGSCYHACQYAPPHEFGVNVPQILAKRRLASYSEYAWPTPLAGLFSRNGLIVSMICVVVLSVVVGGMLVMIAPHMFWGVHIGEGAFYQIMPHRIMAGIPMLIMGFVCLSLIIGWRRYWRETGARWGGVPSLIDAVHAVATLRNLGGDNSGKGAGCAGVDERASNARKWYHHLTFYGFMMCFASTSLGTIYHYGLGRNAPYGYFEAPVLLGTIGGIILCIGTAGLWHEKKRAEPATKSLASMGMDYAFIWLLFWVSATGLILLALRETSFMGLALAVHLGLVYGFFLIMPFSKFVHGLYRFAALLCDAGERRSPSSTNGASA